MENRIFQKSISFDCKYYAFDPEKCLLFYFQFKPFREMRRERERERESTPAPGSLCRRDRTTTEIIPQHQRRHLDRHHLRPIHSKPISSVLTLPISFLFLFSTQNSLASLILLSRSHRTNDLVVSISSPMTHDRSLPFP